MHDQECAQVFSQVTDLVDICHGKHFISSFANQSFVLFAIWQGAPSSHEKGGTMMQFSTMKCRVQPLVQNVDVFFSALTFPS